MTNNRTVLARHGLPEQSGRRLRPPCAWRSNL